jgi:hypothetical protein
LFVESPPTIVFLSFRGYIPTHLPLGITGRKFKHQRRTLAMLFNGIGPPMLALICLTWARIPVKPNAMGFIANKESHEMDLGHAL